MSEKLSVKYDEPIVLATKESGGSGSYTDELIKRINGECGDNFIIPKECKWVASYAFKSAGLSGALTMPSNCNYIGAEAFSSNAQLNNVSISEGVTQIGVRAFADCVLMRTVYIPHTCNLIGNNAFQNTGLTDIFYNGTEEEWHNNVRGIDAAGFPENCTKHFTG